MTDKAERGHFEVLEGFPADVVAVRAHGLIHRDDYEKTLLPLFEETVRREGKAHLYVEFPEDFEGFTAAAAWDDLKLGVLHVGEFARVAIVTDKEWLRMALKVLAPLMPGEVRLFSMAEKDAAREWVSAYVPGAI